MDSRNLQLLIGGLSLLILQEAVMSHVRIFGVHPEMLLLGMLCVALSGGPRRGAVAGFAAGLATDIYGSTTIGVTALSFTVIGWLVGRYIDDRPTAFASGVAAFGGTAGALLLMLIVRDVVDGGSIHFGHAVWVFIVAGLINGLLTVVLVPRMASMWRARELAW